MVRLVVVALGGAGWNCNIRVVHQPKLAVWEKAETQALKSAGSQIRRLSNPQALKSAGSQVRRLSSPQALKSAGSQVHRLSSPQALKSAGSQVRRPSRAVATLDSGVGLGLAEDFG